MNITYTQNGDYLIPNIVIRKTKPLGHYGRLRKAYLKMHRPILFNELVLSDKLFEHCAEIDEAARNRMELIVRSLAEQNGVTEQLKAENQMSLIYTHLAYFRRLRFHGLRLSRLRHGRGRNGAGFHVDKITHTRRHGFGVESVQRFFEFRFGGRAFLRKIKDKGGCLVLVK